MIVLAIILALALAGALGPIVWLTYRIVKGASTEADERVAQNETENLLELEKFEHEKTKQALARSKKRAAALEESLFHELDKTFPDADVDPADHRTRVRRLAEAWRAADEDGDPVPAERTSSVPDTATAGKAEAAGAVSNPNGLVNPFPDLP